MTEDFEEILSDYVSTYRKNHTTQTVWRKPLVAYASATDPLFAELKQIIGPHHSLPGEIVDGAKSVIVYFLPFDENVGKSNIPGVESSAEWDIAYIETNILIGELNKYLHDLLVDRGYDASLLAATHNFDPVTLECSWSHRSAGYIAGLGTFGVNHMLITEDGCNGRLGSIITTMEIEPTQRPTEEYCLYKNRGTCLSCVKRCVNDVFENKDGDVAFDKWRCNEQVFDKAETATYEGLGSADTCGKCLCGVPCSTMNPIRR